MATNTRRVTYANAVMLDPDIVDSSIRYRVNVYRRNNKEHITADITLTDCNKQISWSAFGEEVVELPKRIDKAIEILVGARNDIILASREHLARKKPPGKKRAG